MNFIIDVKGIQNTPMRVILERRESSRDLISFYDLRYCQKFGPDGQSIARYYLETLLKDINNTRGLDLYASEPSWKIDAVTYKLVLNWAQYINIRDPAYIEHLEQKAAEDQILTFYENGIENG